MSFQSVPGIQVLRQERVNQAFQKACEEITPTKGRFVLMTEKYYDAAKEFCVVCFLDDPISKCFGTRWDTPNAIAFWDASLEQNISPALVDEETDEIMAARFVRLEDKDTKSSLEEDPNDPALNDFIRFLDFCEEEANFPEHFPYKEVYNMLGLGTGPKFRNNGYATQLMDFTIRFLRHLELPNCRLIKTGGSSNYSQRVFEKLGFKCIYTKRYADYKIDGEYVMKDTGVHKSLKFYGYYL